MVINNQNTYNSGDILSNVMLTGKCYIEKYEKKVEGICECGYTFWTFLRNLKVGKTKSCGCKMAVQFKHGLSKTPLYKAWGRIKDRCYNDKLLSFKNYGGRGIFLCDEWVNNPEAFIKWSKENGWRKGLTIDRINNDKGYDPNNCRWVSRKVQGRNRRTNVILSAFNEEKFLIDWQSDSRCSVKQNTIMYRIRVLGLSNEKAISLPGKRGNYTKKI